MTGDVGRLDEDGYLTLADRSKDVIISGGTNIYPREVEEVLLTHPGVHEVSVVGRPSAEWGEDVVAFVVAMPGATLDAATLDAHCLENIARFKRPKDYVFVPDLPKNNYGKVLKTELRTRLRGGRTMTDLTGKTALVTGSVQGIGLAIATALAEAGARIAVHGLAGDAQIEDVLRPVARRGIAAGGVLSRRSAQSRRHRPDDAGGRGLGRRGYSGQQRRHPAHRAAGRDAARPVGGDPGGQPVGGVPYHAGTRCRGWPRTGYGRVINIASVHGLVASKDKAPYVAAKFGLVGLSQVAALEYADAGTKAQGGVTVNCICPGWTETAIIEPQIAARAELHGGDRDRASPICWPKNSPASAPRTRRKSARWRCGCARRSPTT